MRAESKIKFKIIKTRVNASLSFRYLYGNGLANTFANVEVSGPTTKRRQQQDKVFIGNKKTKQKEKCMRIQITTPWRGTSSTSPGRERKKSGTPGIRHFWFVL